MTYLVAADLPLEPAGTRFRVLLQADAIVRLPGAHSGLAAMQAKRAGFVAVYVSGAAVSASMGLPDAGLLTSDDLCGVVRQVVRACGLPVLVDGDAGYGEALNVMHLVRSLEDAGAAAVHIEDQVVPRKCGHLNERTLATQSEMVMKITAATRARKHLYIIARTDAAADEGVSGAVARASAYLAAGADAIFATGLTSRDMLESFVGRIKGPVLANMPDFGHTPYFTAAEFQDMGYKMVIWPVSSVRISGKSQELLYTTLERTGGTKDLAGQMLTRQELLDVIDSRRYESLDQSVADSVRAGAS
jgi:methylisocitrate lyase